MRGTPPPPPFSLPFRRYESELDGSPFSLPSVMGASFPPPSSAGPSGCRQWFRTLLPLFFPDENTDNHPCIFPFEVALGREEILFFLSLGPDTPSSSFSLSPFPLEEMSPFSSLPFLLFQSSRRGTSPPASLCPGKEETFPFSLPLG